MAISLDMQEVITQVANEAATATERAMREAVPTAEPHTRRSSPEEPHKSRQAGPILN